MEVKCNDCKSEYWMTQEEWDAGHCLICGSTNIEQK